MRSLVRAFAATAALTALLLSAAAAPAFAASSGESGAETGRYVFDDDWCFDDGWQVNCTVSHGTLSVTITPDGREMARIHFREAVHSYQDGVEVGSFKVNSFDRTVFADGGQDSTFTVSHLNARSDGSKCVYTYLLKIVDYELIKEQLNGPSCS